MLFQNRRWYQNYITRVSKKKKVTAKNGEEINNEMMQETISELLQFLGRRDPLMVLQMDEMRTKPIGITGIFRTLGQRELEYL